MKCNVGGIDRILRIAVGALLVALAITNVVGWWAWLGLIPLTTGLFRFCPAYPRGAFKSAPLFIYIRFLRLSH